LSRAQKRIFMFGAPGYLDSPSGSFATTDVMQISTTRARYIHLTSCSNSKTYYHILNSVDIRNKSSQLNWRKRQGWSYMTTLALHIYCVPHWPLVIWKMVSGLLFHKLYAK